MILDCSYSVADFDGKDHLAVSIKVPETSHDTQIKRLLVKLIMTWTFVEIRQWIIKSQQSVIIAFAFWSSILTRVSLVS